MLAQDRTSVVFLRGPKAAEREPLLAQLDGSEAEPCSTRRSADDCPYSRRPAESADGRWALVCIDDDGDTLGLYVVDTDGTLHPLVRRTSPAGHGGPTWTGDGDVIFVVADGESTSLWHGAGDGSERGPAAGRCRRAAGSPDWSPEGLLYLPSERSTEPGDVYVWDEDGRTPDSRSRARSSGRPGHPMAAVRLRRGRRRRDRSLFVRTPTRGTPSPLSVDGRGSAGLGSALRLSAFCTAAMNSATSGSCCSASADDLDALVADRQLRAGWGGALPRAARTSRAPSR